MALTIMKRIKFAAGHRLYGHEGKCAFFHGHNYTAEIFVTGNETDRVGRLIDFGELKRAFKGWIDENWDHSFLLWQEDSNGLDAISRVEPCRYFVMPYNPTAENMARYLLEEVAPQLMQDLPVIVSKVIIWETEDSYAEANLANIEDPLASYCAATGYVKS